MHSSVVSANILFRPDGCQARRRCAATVEVRAAFTRCSDAARAGSLVDCQRADAAVGEQLGERSDARRSEGCAARTGAEGPDAASADAHYGRRDAPSHYRFDVFGTAPLTISGVNVRVLFRQVRRGIDPSDDRPATSRRATAIIPLARNMSSIRSYCGAGADDVCDLDRPCRSANAADRPSRFASDKLFPCGVVLAPTRGADDRSWPVF